MAENEMLKRYLDAGIAFTQMTQRRAEGIVRELVRTGELQTGQAQAKVEELVERSRQNTDRLLDLVRGEIRAQVSNLGLATRADIDALRREIAQLRAERPATTTRATTRGTKAPAARKAAAKKAGRTTKAAKKA